jgi:hypothetical protein
VKFDFGFRTIPQCSTLFPVVANGRAERPSDNNNPACNVLKLPGTYYVGGRKIMGVAVLVRDGSNVGVSGKGVGSAVNSSKGAGAGAGVILGGFSNGAGTGEILGGVVVGGEAFG